MPTDNLDELIKVCERATATAFTAHVETLSPEYAEFSTIFMPQRCLALLKELKRLQGLTKDFRELFNLEDQPHE